MLAELPKPVEWVGSSQADLKTFPAAVRGVVGYALYVLHALQKKAKRGIATPKPEIDLIRRRLRAAEQQYSENYGGA